MRYIIPILLMLLSVNAGAAAYLGAQYGYSQYGSEITDKYKKPMKLAKRMFVIAKMKKDKRVGDKLVTLFRSDINLLNYVAGQIDVVISMLEYIVEKRKAPNINILYDQLDELKLRVSTIMDIEFDKDAFYDIINEVTKGDMKPKDMIDVLKPLKKHLLEIVGDYTKKYLKSNKLWPGPYFDTKNLIFMYG